MGGGVFVVAVLPTAVVLLFVVGADDAADD
jgi:hypothetical protein